MANYKSIEEMVGYYQRVRNAYLAAHVDTLIRVATDARKRTIQNAKKRFIGRNGRRLSGQLFKAIQNEFTGDFRHTQNIGKLPIAYVVVRSRYGAIHEFGGEIKPKNAQNLWIPKQHQGEFKRLTPREFFKLRSTAQLAARGKKGRERIGLVQYIIKRHNSKSATAMQVEHTGGKPKITPLFALVKNVKMPKRPYVNPAIIASLRLYGLKYNKALKDTLVQSRFLK